MSLHYRDNNYITEKERELIKQFPLFISTTGVGNIIAECVLYLGFENITIADELELDEFNIDCFDSGLGGGANKATVLKEKLMSINNQAKIKIFDGYLTSENITDVPVNEYGAVINTLRFSSNLPLMLDDMCQKEKVPVIHSFIVGDGGIVTLIDSEGLSLKTIVRDNEKLSELKILEYISSYMKFWGDPQLWMDEWLVMSLKDKKKAFQGSTSGLWEVGNMCVYILFDLVAKRAIKKFPDIYFLTPQSSND